MNTDRKEARNKRDLQIDELKSVNSELQSRMAHDEGLAAGAFAIVGGLSTLGLLRKRNEVMGDDRGVLSIWAAHRQLFQS